MILPGAALSPNQWVHLFDLPLHNGKRETYRRPNPLYSLAFTTGYHRYKIQML